jgi:hypothetical protein
LTCLQGMKARNMNHDVETILSLDKREEGEMPRPGGNTLLYYNKYIIRSQAYVGVDDDVLTVRGGDNTLPTGHMLSRLMARCDILCAFSKKSASQWARVLMGILFLS